MIAMGLMMEPVLLIADERRQRLMSRSRLQIMDVLNNINRTHNTAIIPFPQSRLIVRTASASW